MRGSVVRPMVGVQQALATPNARSRTRRHAVESGGLSPTGTLCSPDSDLERRSAVSSLYRRPGREELHRTAAGEPCPELRAGFTEELARHRSSGDDRVHQVGEVLAVLYERVGVAEPLDDDALRFVVVEVGVVLQRSRVLGADDLHA